MRFSKDLVIEEIIKAGNKERITPDIINDLNNFDGQEAIKSNWDALVKNEENYIVTGLDGRKIKVDRRFIK